MAHQRLRCPSIRPTGRAPRRLLHAHPHLFVVSTKGFSNRDITFLSINKTLKYLIYSVKIYCGVVKSLNFMNEIRYRSYDHHEPVYSGRFFGPNFPPLWHTFRPERWQFCVGCCLSGRLKLLARRHRPVT